MTLKRLTAVKIAALAANHNLNGHPNQCQAGEVLLQVFDPRGPVDDIGTHPIWADHIV